MTFSLRVPLPTDVCVCGHSRLYHATVRHASGTYCAGNNCVCEGFRLKEQDKEKKDKNASNTSR